MQNILRFIILAGNIFGIILFLIAFLGLRQMLKEHDKQNHDDILSDKEGKRYHQYLLYLLIGFSISVITSLINLILLFAKKPF
jgi:H+/gluconate symporter-like permease